MTAQPPDPGSIIYLKDWFTLVALILGPVLGVWWTLFHQDRTEKRGAKIRLFTTLMAHRRSPPTPEWAAALNLIDVVFADNRSIVNRWHELYDIVIQQQAGSERWNHAYLTLLSEMAELLGYSHMRQTDIDKFYLPQAQADLNLRQFEVQTEFLRVLKKSRSFSHENP